MGDQRARVRRLRAAQHQPTREAEVASWPDTVRPAVGAGAQEAQVGLGAAYGSNWVGPFSRDDRMALRAAQVEAWEAAGIVPTRVSLADTMAWNTPSEVSGDLEEIRRRWPAITRFHLHLHLHNTRGCAQVSLYEALRLLGPECVVEADCSIGGMAGCPYCGNGRAATLTPTEDLVHLLESLGYYTGSISTRWSTPSSSPRRSPVQDVLLQQREERLHRKRCLRRRRLGPGTRPGRGP